MSSSTQLHVSDDILRAKRRSKLKNEPDSIKLKRESSSDTDVGSLRLKNDDPVDEEADGPGYVEDDDQENLAEEDGFVDADDDEDEKYSGDAKDDNCKASSDRKTSHGFHFVQGKMGHKMEDYIVAKKKELRGDQLGLYAIFDGHSGRAVSEYLQGHLFDNILNESDFWTNPKAAIKRAYRTTDDEIMEEVVGSRGGSTAVTAILVNSEKLIVANVGDSRAILSRNGKAKAITIDHEPELEKDQVESRGGFVSHKPGNVPRVDGQLAMTRAFGDERLKEHITEEPDIFVETVDEDTEFIILASDGLWKVMSNQDAVDCIKDMDDAKEASRELIKEALDRKSRDDISCIVVMFH